jgi:hypothetical protein
MKIYDQYLEASNYPYSHFVYSSNNENVSGMFKDEFGGVPALKIVILKRKRSLFIDPDNNY